MKDVPPARQTDKQTGEPGIYNKILNPSVFYCIIKYDERRNIETPEIILKLREHHSDPDLKNFASNFKKNVKDIFNINNSLERYKIHLNDNLLCDKIVIALIKKKDLNLMIIMEK